MNNLSPIFLSTVNHTQTIKKNVSKPIESKTINSIQQVSEMKNPDYIPSKMLLSLLKCGLNDDTKANAELFKGRTDEDWVRMYNLGHDNAVTPMLLEGLEKSPEINAPKEVIEAMQETDMYAKRYHMKQERVLGEVMDISAKKGIDVVPIKGIGFSLNYPNPQRRFGGDIDVFTFKHSTDFSEPENNMTNVFDEIFEKQGIDIKKTNPKHSEFEYRGMPIENHRTFVDVKNRYLCVPDALKINNYLLEHLKPTEQTLPMGTKILTPSKEFNTVFLAYHSMTHFIGSGINFHHLADWAVHIKKNGLKVPEETKGTSVERFMYAMTNLSNKYLGTKVKAPEDKKLENAIFNKMLDPLNQYGENSVKQPTSKNPLAIIKYKFEKLNAKCKDAQMFPEFYSKQERSLPRRILKYIKLHILNPEYMKDIIKIK